MFELYLWHSLFNSVTARSASCALEKWARKSVSKFVQFVHGAFPFDSVWMCGVAHICARPVSRPSACRNLSLSVVTDAFVNHVLHCAMNSRALTGFQPS